MSYGTLPLTDLLDAFASNAPVPGGGSAAALTGALGVSLLMMVAGLPRTRSGTPEAASDLAATAARLRPLRDGLVALVDEDSRAYAAVLEAMRLPRTTADERTTRRSAMDAAMRTATEVPLDTMRRCQQALVGAAIVAEHGNPNAETDTGTAVELLQAALRSAAMNIDVNLRGVADEAFVSRVRLERQQLEADADADASCALTLLGRDG